MLELDTIVVGDCLDVMRQMPDGYVDTIITDPPFAFIGGNSHGRTSQIQNQFFSNWWTDVCAGLKRVCKPEGEGFIWCDWKSAVTIADGFPEDQKYTWWVSQILYHFREMPGMGRPFRSSVDMIAYIRGPKSNGQRVSNDTLNFISQYWYYGKHPNHPAEKSVEMCERLIEWCSDEGMIVFDPFIGSGTTAVAALKLGRRFYGCDIDPGYVEVANRRIEQTRLEMAQMEMDLTMRAKCSII
jgi:DNA modification methylase